MPTGRSAGDDLESVRREIRAYYAKRERQPLTPSDRERYEALLTIEKQLMATRRESQDQRTNRP